MRWKIRKCARQYCDKRCTLIKTRNKDDKMCSSVRGVLCTQIETCRAWLEYTIEFDKKRQKEK